MAHAPSLVQPLLYYAGHSSKPAALRSDRLRSFGPVAKFLEGSGAALLAYSGAGAVTDGAGGIPAAGDFASLDDLTRAALEGDFTGPAQLAAAAALFIVAGRSNARMIGLFAGLAFIYFYSQGVTLSEMLAAGAEIVGRLSQALTSASRYVAGW